MKRKRFSEEQIVAVLQTVARGEKTIAEVCKEQGLSKQTYYRWRQRYGGMQQAEVRRLRELEQENSRLKRLLAERDLEIDIIKRGLKKRISDRRELTQEL
jgi:putative transposase